MSTVFVVYNGQVWEFAWWFPDGWCVLLPLRAGGLPLKPSQRVPYEAALAAGRALRQTAVPEPGGEAVAP